MLTVTGPRVAPGARALLLAALLAAEALLWGGVVQRVWRTHGLFSWIGVDYALYYAQARILDLGKPHRLYAHRPLDWGYDQLTAAWSRQPPRTSTATLVPYPAAFSGAFRTFTKMGPIAGFAAWTAFGLLAAVLLAWPGVRTLRWPAPALVLIVGSLPIGYALFVGQAQTLVACAVGWGVLLLARSRDFAAGLLISVALIKPQYGVLLGPLLVWKRRWRTVGGVAAGAAVLAAASLAVAGVEGLRHWPEAFGDKVGFRSDFARHMTNYRTLVLAAFPTIDDVVGARIAIALGLATALAALAAFRGPWRPADPRFAARMTLLLAATVVSNYHSHAYGASILVASATMLFAGPVARGATRVVLVGLCVVPTLSFTWLWPARVEVATDFLAVLLVALLVTVALDLRAAGRGPAAAVHAPPATVV